jgi:hypothetical protein
MAASSASGSNTSSVFDDDDRLHAYSIRVNSTSALPTLLRSHLEKVVRVTRTSSSPAAKLTRRNQPRAENLNEPTAIGILVDNILFCGEAEGGEQHILRVSEAILNRKYLPDAPEAYIATQYGNLTQPKVDTAIGYIPSRDADAGGVTGPLSLEEELVVMKDAVSSALLFPFLTCQWKSAKGSQGHWHAQRQSARDGAAIVNYLHAFYAEAGIAPSFVDTCHWSLTCDTQTVSLYLHWRTEEAGNVTHHMRKVEQEFLRALDDEENVGMVKFRHRLRNILDYAVGARLDNIKAAIPAVKQARSKIRKRPPQRSSSRRSQTGHAVSDEGYSDSCNPLYAAPSMPAPSSPTASPDPKRPRSKKVGSLT